MSKRKPEWANSEFWNAFRDMIERFSHEASVEPVKRAVVSKADVDAGKVKLVPAVSGACVQLDAALKTKPAPFRSKHGIGDIVELVSGSPRMTVTHVDQYTCDVVWYMGDHCGAYAASTFQTITLPHECLRLIAMNPARVN